MHYNLLLKIGRHFVPFTVPSVVVVVVICHCFLFVCPVIFVVVAVASVFARYNIEAGVAMFSKQQWRATTKERKMGRER